tara:strand:- start:2658 stop:3338 length:681 start_codon:yes stop_codon:yes gene_type:complete
VYKRLVERIRARVAEEFGLTSLYFTAPTFITRQVCMRMRKVQQRFFTSPHLLRSPPHLTSLYFFTQIGNASWTPNEIHDEYWHPHVDKENTAHYDYSALLYLADSNLDFTGGEFRWIDDDEAGKAHDYNQPHLPAEWEDGVHPDASTLTVFPKKGRLVFFSAGRENLHQVRKIKSGTRYALSLWFSCDRRRRFKNFLDGKEHVAFETSAAAAAADEKEKGEEREEL